MIKAFLGGLLGSLLLLGCASVAQRFTNSSQGEVEALDFAVSPDAMGDVDAALERAKASDKRVMLVMGANWCHDSRDLARWLNTERFKRLIAEEYELVLVNIGMPQTGDGHNLEIAKRFGLDELPGSPNVLIVTPDGKLVNPDTATTWRNAASRSEDEIYSELAQLAR